MCIRFLASPILSLLALLLAASGLHAQSVFLWNGGAGNWTTGANWSTGTVPNSPSADVLIDNGKAGSSDVTLLNANATIGRLTIDAGDSLSFANTTNPAQQFILTVTQGAFPDSGTILNNGILKITADPAHPMVLRIGNSASAETVTLNGTGSLILGDSKLNQITAISTVQTFVNNSTISGAGTVGSSLLKNTGTITATSLTTPLIVTAGSLITNTGRIQASAGSTLRLQGAGFGSATEGLNNAGGTIEANGSGAVVELTPTRVRGGTLRTTGGGSIRLLNNNMNLDGSITPITIATGSDVRIPEGAGPDAKGTLVINGTLTIGSTSGAARLQVADLFAAGPQALTLNGTGSVVMGDNAGNEINGNNGGSTLTTNIPITGSGKIGGNSLDVTNNSTITSNGAAGMVLDPFATFVNGVNGTIRSSGSGVLAFNPGSFTNNGLIEAIGGNISGVPTATFTNYNSTTKTLTGGTWRVLGAYNMALAGIGAVVTNAANIELSGVGSTFTPINSIANNQGSFTLRNKRDFATIGALTSSGTLHVDGTAVLTINGSLNLTSIDSALHFDLNATPPAASYNFVDVKGNVQFKGALRLTLARNLRTALTGSETFTLLRSNASIIGAFDNATSGARISAVNGGGSFLVNYGPGSRFGADKLVLSDFQIEPLPPSQLLNISTRLRVLTGDNALIGGFIITGSDAKKVIIRGLGPSLGAAGIQGALANPTLELHAGDGTVLATNDNWKESQQGEIEATTIPPSNDLESAIVLTLAPGAYTAVVSGKGNTIGVGLVEVYDLSQASASKLANISTRGFVNVGDEVMIGGFIVGGGGGGSAKVIVRGLGPALTSSGVSGALQDPTLELRDGNGGLVASNDNWKETQQAAIEATTIPPRIDMESAIVANLGPGPYTAILRGKNDSTGIGLVEVYALP